MSFNQTLSCLLDLLDATSFYTSSAIAAIGAIVILCQFQSAPYFVNGARTESNVRRKRDGYGDSGDDHKTEVKYEVVCKTSNTGELKKSQVKNAHYK